MNRDEQDDLAFHEEALQAQRWAVSYVQTSIALRHAEKDLPVSAGTMVLLDELSRANHQVSREIRSIQRRLGR